MKCDTNADSGSIMDQLADRAIWMELYERKKANNLYDCDSEMLAEIFSNPRFENLCRQISEESYDFSIPVKRMIPKSNGKLRTIYQFNRYEMVALKLLSYLMHSYDHLFSPNLYSFRRGVSVREAIRTLFRLSGLRNMWGYKADIHDYFNSVDVNILLPELRDALEDDRLFSLFERILSNPYVREKGVVHEESKGVMAGIPISAFLANFYLKDVDSFFYVQDCIYMRYADDILILADSEDKLLSMRALLLQAIKSRGLEMNPDKERFFEPGEEFEFLGFSVSSERIDISKNTVRKIKGKIRRSSRAIRRWMLTKNAPVKGTIRALIRCYNRRFYGYEDGELSWSRWYLPTITTTESLHKIDQYFQEWIRYVATGRHSKKNHEIVTYDDMRRCGYIPLVSAYYSQFEKT